MSSAVIFILINVVAAGRSGAAPGALCVEVLKTSAGLGLSLDGGKSSLSGDGPLVVKRVYKGNVLESSVSRLLPLVSTRLSEKSVPSIWKSNLI